MNKDWTQSPWLNIIIQLSLLQQFYIISMLREIKELFDILSYGSIRKTKTRLLTGIFLFFCLGRRRDLVTLLPVMLSESSEYILTLLACESSSSNDVCVYSFLLHILLRGFLLESYTHMDYIYM